MLHFTTNVDEVIGICQAPSHSFRLNSTRITSDSPLDHISVGAEVNFMLSSLNVKIKATNIYMYHLIDAR